MVSSKLFTAKTQAYKPGATLTAGQVAGLLARGALTSGTVLVEPGKSKEPMPPMGIGGKIGPFSAHALQTALARVRKLESTLPEPVPIGPPARSQLELEVAALSERMKREAMGFSRTILASMGQPPDLVAVRTLSPGARALPVMK